MLDRSPITPKAGLTAENVVLEIAGQRLIDGISLTLDPGSLTVILGPNGAGKSLFLRLAHGLIAPTSGRILWGGEPAGPSTRARQAMVFQKPVLLRRSALANVAYAIAASRNGRSEQVATSPEDCLESVGLAHVARRPARLLSGGEQQRLAIARALATRPDVLFLDEPTASLDPASTLLIENIIATTRDKGIKVIMVTHDAGQARRLAGDVLFVNRGRIAEHSDAETFFQDPTSSAGRDFLAGRIIL